MIVLGLTGSIGMGKSSAAGMLKIMGVPVHDSDRAVHEALAKKGSAVKKVAALFPDAWDEKRECIDRNKLGAIVFQDKVSLKKLEEILHPVAQQSQKDFIKDMKTKGKKAVVLEIPLLFETGAQNRVDYTICVTAPSATQKRRVMKRKGMSEEKFARILESQMADREKQARSDYVVQTGLGYVHTYRGLYKILKELGLK